MPIDSITAEADLLWPQSLERLNFLEQWKATEPEKSEEPKQYWWLLECGHYGRGLWADTPLEPVPVYCAVCARPRRKVKRV